MKKSKAIRLAGFAGALCASAALLATSVSGTGAYFTDSQSGGISASTGHVKVVISDGQLNFNNLLPGDDQTKGIDYYPQGTAAEDIWLVFPTTGTADAFLHTPRPGATPLGRYGHFKLTSSGGAGFESYNLAASPSGYNSADSCYIDANGEGGSAAQIAKPTDDQPYCAPRPAILLQSNMVNGTSGHVDLTFGFTKLLKGNAIVDSPSASVVKFSIVATQHGVRADDPFNG